MAATAQGEALTEAHRLAQARLADATTVQLFQVWPLLDPSNIDATFDRWLAAAVPIVQAQHATSQLIARTYSEQFRIAEIGLGAAGYDQPPLAPVAIDAVRTSLLVTGPYALRSATARGTVLATSSTTAAVATAAAGARHVLSGGRSYLAADTAADPAAHGYRRVCSGRCCSFCALLAARNYDGLSSDFFKSHDHCRCQPETAFHTGRGTVPRQAREFAALYHEATAGVTGGPAAQRNAFRRALEAQRAA